MNYSSTRIANSGGGRRGAAWARRRGRYGGLLACAMMWPLWS
jgi:hypothetical protein